MALIYECSECGSKNTDVKTERYNEKYEFKRGIDEGDFSMAGHILHKELTSYDTRIVCKCKDCGFEERIY